MLHHSLLTSVPHFPIPSSLKALSAAPGLHIHKYEYIAIPTVSLHYMRVAKKLMKKKAPGEKQNRIKIETKHFLSRINCPSAEWATIFGQYLHFIIIWVKKLHRKNVTSLIMTYSSPHLIAISAYSNADVWNKRLVVLISNGSTPFLYYDFSPMHGLKSFSVHHHSKKLSISWVLWVMVVYV